MVIIIVVKLNIVTFHLQILGFHPFLEFPSCHCASSYSTSVTMPKVFMSRTFNGVINCGAPPLNHFIDVSLGLYHSATMASTPQGLVHQETVHLSSSFSSISSTNPKEILPPADSGTFSFIQIPWMLNPCSFFLYNLH